MKNKLSKRDWETTSAYLDGQLSPRKQARFETRLHQDAELQNIFKELNRTRQILRRAPRLRAPRNFMLTPEMAGTPRRLPNLAPVFGWASAAASFLLILVLVGDIFSAGGFVSVANRVAPQDELMAQTVEDGASLPAPQADEMPVMPDDAASSENAAQAAPGEVAVNPEFEAASADQAVTQAKEIEMFGAAEAETAEMPADDEATFAVAVDTSPEDGDADKDARKAGEPQADEFIIASADPEADQAAISNTVSTESLADQPVEAPSAEEQAAAPEPQTKQAEPPAPEPAQATPTWETAPVESTPPDSDKTSDFVMGIETILALFAAGAGLAWFYLRRRGG